MRVYVYRNLHKGCLSVRSCETRRVIAHVDSIVLTNCKFKVSASGRERVRREGHKNVHAGIEGHWMKDQEAPDASARTQVVYDPYRFDTFVEKDTLAPCFTSEDALVTIQGAFIQKK